MESLASTSSALWQWDATALAHGIRTRRISSREAVVSCVERLHAVNPQLNAVTCDLSEQAIALADRADIAVARAGAASRELGPLHGVPITIKESTDQAGCATVNGVAAFKDVIADADNPVVANLKGAGAVILGRTNTPAFSFRLATDNTFRGRTHNPWSRLHTPGGSSGGAASSLAAGITPLAHGNDSAGSLRFPAYCNGVMALRPSLGRVPAYNPSATTERPITAQLLSVQGPMARSVRDLRAGLAAMARGDPRDPWWVPVPLVGPRQDTPIRVVVVDDAAALGGLAPGGPIAAALAQAAEALTDAGYEVVSERTPGFARAFELWLEIFVPEFRRFALADCERDGDDGFRTAAKFLLANVPERGDDAHLRALAERTRVMREWSVFLARTPLVLAPVCTQLPYTHGFDVESVERTMQVWRESATMMAIPVLGLPAAAIPTGVADGLPVGIQIMAARFREDLALDAAEAIESRVPRITPIDPIG
jgi:amidase